MFTFNAVILQNRHNSTNGRVGGWGGGVLPDLGIFIIVEIFYGFLHTKKSTRNCNEEAFSEAVERVGYFGTLEIPLNFIMN